MNLSASRDCPICGGRPRERTFPYSTKFNDKLFNYLKCENCKSAFIDPLPTKRDFKLIYSKDNYHDLHYKKCEKIEYILSAQLFKKYLIENAKALDYGCGIGTFLTACSEQGIQTVGVEFDEKTAQFAKNNSNCNVLSIDEFIKEEHQIAFDGIHLGDVLEHIPDPKNTLNMLVTYLKPGGILFIEGPLETNPSLVFWAARLFGIIKRMIYPNFNSSQPPTHLFLTNANAQIGFFKRIDANLKLQYWEVIETGWPYKNMGFLKNSIAATAIYLGGLTVANITLGNRFKAILVKDKIL
jgi:SAM-dependent methyltransferase